VSYPRPVLVDPQLCIGRDIRAELEVAAVEMYADLTAYARRMVGDGAEDLVQEALTRAWECPPFRPGTWRPWTFAIARRLAMQGFRVRDVLDQAASIEDTPWLV